MRKAPPLSRHRRFCVAQGHLALFAILPGLWPWLAAASGFAGFDAAAVAITPERRT